MGVLDVVDRVVVALAGHLGDIERERRVDRVPDQRVAQRVDADEVDQLAERDQGAGALGELQLLAVLHDLDHLADEHLELFAGGVADAGGHRREPADVAVVVGPEQVDAGVEAPLALVDVVGGVGREVGELAVGADDHAVLVVAEVGGAHPGGTVLLEDVAELLQPGEPVLEGVALVQRVLGEPDVEVRVHLLELGSLLGELDLVADVTEHATLLVVRLLEHDGRLREDPVGELADVLAVVAVLGWFLAMGTGHEGRTELVHLGTAVVDVELAGDGCPRGFEHPGDRVADGGPAGVAEVQRAGGVGADELEVDAPAGVHVARAVGLAGAHDVGRRRRPGNRRRPER